MADQGILSPQKLVPTGMEIRKSKRKRVPTKVILSNAMDETKTMAGKKHHDREKNSKSSSQGSKINLLVKKTYDRVKRLHASQRVYDTKSVWAENSKNLSTHQMEQMNLKRLTRHAAIPSVQDLKKEDKIESSSIEGPYTNNEATSSNLISSEQATFVLNMRETFDSKISKFIENQTIQKVGVITIPSLSKIPPVLQWTSIPYNVNEDDGKFLTNIPFLGDEIIDKDKKFIDDMMNLYEGKVHGIYDNTESLRMENDIFYELVKALMELESRNGSNIFVEESNTPSIRAPDLKNRKMDNEAAEGKDHLKTDYFEVAATFKIPSNDIFSAISSTFKGIGAAGELKERFFSIQKKRSRPIVKLPLLQTGVEKQDPSTYLIPNIEGNFAKDLPKNSAMHAYQFLFCRRCFQYDCTRGHNGDDQVDLNHYKEKRNSQGVNSLSFNCKNPDCWQRVTQEESPKSKETILAKWNSGDKSMFRCLIESFPNHCYIAELLMKSCQEVHEYAIIENAPTRDNNFCIASTSFPHNSNQSISSNRSNNNNKRRPKPWNKKSSSANKKNLARRWINNVNRSEKSSGGIKTGGFLPPKFMPCQHNNDVECDEKNPNCYCGHNGTSCEKFCTCSVSCKRRFPGCRCTSTCDSKRCVCFFAARECDADLCSGCGAHEHVVNKITCKNVNIQRRLHKHLLIGQSEVAGWGIFIKEDAQKGEFIAEYRGEIISHDESERRGHVYDKIQHTFLFELNDHFVVDATRKGNKARFVNSSKNPNCEVKRMLVNGDHRIGIYAKRYIDAGEELFYDYEDVIEKQQKVAAASTIISSNLATSAIPSVTQNLLQINSSSTPT